MIGVIAENQRAVAVRDYPRLIAARLDVDDAVGKFNGEKRLVVFHENAGFVDARHAELLAVENNFVAEVALNQISLRVGEESIGDNLANVARVVELEDSFIGFGLKSLAVNREVARARRLDVNVLVVLFDNKVRAVRDLDEDAVDRDAFREVAADFLQAVRRVEGHCRRTFFNRISRLAV